MNLSAIRSGLANLIDNISGLRVVERVTDSVQPPVAVIAVGDGIYDDDFDGDSTVALSVLLLASRASDAANGQKLLDEYLNATGTKSLRAAVNAEPTLGGAAQSARVIGWQNYNGRYNLNGVEYAGVEVQVEVFC